MCPVLRVSVTTAAYELHPLKAVFTTDRLKCLTTSWKGTYRGLKCFSLLSAVCCFVYQVSLKVDRDRVHYCTLCNNGSTESEARVLVHCDIYADIRVELFSTRSWYIVHFNDLDDANKLCVILSGKHCINKCAKAATSS